MHKPVNLGLLVTICSIKGLSFGSKETDPWQVVPRQVFFLFIPYDCLLISVAFVGPFRVGCLWITGVLIALAKINFARYGTSRCLSKLAKIKETQRYFTCSCYFTDVFSYVLLF